MRQKNDCKQCNSKNIYMLRVYAFGDDSTKRQWYLKNDLSYSIKLTFFSYK